MVPIKKNGETNKQYIRRLGDFIHLECARWSNFVNGKDMIINDLKENFNVVSKFEHDKALSKIEELRSALKKYGLWTGQ